jgi:hypothetical protein
MKGLSDCSDDAEIHATRSNVGHEKSGTAQLLRMKMLLYEYGSRFGRRVS